MEGTGEVLGKDAREDIKEDGNATVVVTVVLVRTVELSKLDVVCGKDDCEADACEEDDCGDVAFNIWKTGELDTPSEE